MKRHKHPLPPRDKVVTCHLGDGSGVAASWNGERFVVYLNPDRVIVVVAWSEG